MEKLKQQNCICRIRLLHLRSTNYLPSASSYPLIKSFDISMNNFKIVLFSDIDDTIAISHIVDNGKTILEWLKFKLQWFGHGFIHVDHLAGMDYLYQQLQGHGIDIFYISGMPKWVNKATHGGASSFLRKCGFPSVENLVLRENSKIETKAFKVSSIAKILKERYLNHFKPDEFLCLLVGDNGEKDIEVYHEIEQQFPQLTFITYIHKLYEGNPALPLLPNQQLYITPAELALQLYRLNLGIITEAEVKIIYHEVEIGLGIDKTVSKIGGHLEELIGQYLSIPNWADITPADLARVKAILTDPKLAGTALDGTDVYQAIEKRVETMKND